MIVFAMNNAVHSTTQYSPFEVVFLERPRFPLFGHFEPDLKNVPLDLHRYVQNCSEKLAVMREQVLENIHMAQDQMVSRYNSKALPLNLQVGDYVLLSMDPKGQGQKLQHKFEGPFVVHSIPSPHMVTLKDPTTNICRKDTYIWTG